MRPSGSCSGGGRPALGGFAGDGGGEGADGDLARDELGTPLLPAADRFVVSALVGRDGKEADDDQTERETDDESGDEGLRACP